MNWNLWGLCLNFLGTSWLIWDSFSHFGRERTHAWETHPYGDERTEILRDLKTKEGYKELRGLSPEEKTMIASLFLIWLGFVFQIVGLVVSK